MRFLVIDDSPYDRELVIRKLQQYFADASYVQVSQRSELDAALREDSFDLVLVDYRLKWTTGLDLLALVRERFSDLPVIMVTDTGSEEIATEGMKRGLTDYVLKRHLTRLPLAVQESLAKKQLQAERKALEEQVRQAQKMESLGVLVSGIAHDFNNILAGVSGYAERSLALVDAQTPLYENLDRIHQGIKRASRLTRQLLAFARRQTLSSTIVNVNVVIGDLLEFLRSALGPNITIEFEPDPGLALVSADVTQLEQVLLNLCINARDAMPEGGVVRVKTQNVQLEENAGQQFPPSSAPGPYVLCTVTDTGTGMDARVQTRLFEPFFTTKDVDKGTGLGLSVVYGIIEQHHGIIRVQSQLGEGTSFFIYLPAVEQDVITPAQERIEPPIHGAGETVLVVEDDLDLRRLIEDVLQEYGYAVLMASDGKEGIAVFEQHIDTIKLVISDLLMPRMKGKEFQARICEIAPDARFLFISGYRGSDLDQQDPLTPNEAFLQKPFDLDVLVNKVQMLLV